MDELPLLELFTRLREAGLPLGIDEYRLVLHALQAGFGTTDQAALKRLCQSLWVKSADEMQIFNYYFDQVIVKEPISPTPPTSALQSRQREIAKITPYVALGGMFMMAAGIVMWDEYRPVIYPPVNPSPSETTIQIPNPAAPQTTVPQTAVLTRPAVFQPVVPQQENLGEGDTLMNQIDRGMKLIAALISGCIVVASVARLIKRHRSSNNTFLSKPTTSVPTSATSSELTQKIEDEVQVAQAVLQATSRDSEIPKHRFILTTEHFPVSQRQMKQLWRYLRRPVREGPRTELDVEATVNQIGRQGILLEPMLVPRRVNRAQMLLLIDQDGSMVPFHSLSRRLAETALCGGRLGRADLYYFHNCPVEYLYRDPVHQEAELLSILLARLCYGREAVLIISDAGAARGGFSLERTELTAAFLAQLKQRVRYIAWLNPIPRSRWTGTTAGEIARLVPMFEVSRRGLQDAISVLRGRPTNFEGLIK